MAAVDGPPEIDAQYPLPIIQGYFTDGRAAGPTPALLITSVGAASNQDCDCSANEHTSSTRETSQRIAMAFAPRSVSIAAVL